MKGVKKMDKIIENARSKREHESVSLPVMATIQEVMIIDVQGYVIKYRR